MLSFFAKRLHQQSVRYFNSVAPYKKNLTFSRIFGAGLASCGCVVVGMSCSSSSQKNQDGIDVLKNWSDTHSCRPGIVHAPETSDEVEEIVRHAHERGSKLRAVGTALSPNGIAFNNDGEELVSLVHLDKVIAVDVKKKQVKIQAGATVSQVVTALKDYGLTLANFASINQQQLGGFYQVGAHGTGISIPPVEEQIVALTLVTPGKGRLQLRVDDPDEENRKLFHLACVGLGCLGVVTDFTIQCVDAHILEEKTQVLSREEVVKSHKQRLQSTKHVRYMWIPYTDSVVVVSSNPVDKIPPKQQEEETAQALSALRELIMNSDQSLGKQHDLKSMNFAELRDIALLCGGGPCDVNHVIKVNKAEAEYWKHAQGVRYGQSDSILNFECGGEQWVSEVAFPVGSIDNLDMSDLSYMQQLLAQIELEKIPAPSPIEQRWTFRSRALMSPAHGDGNQVFSWVGIIMYLPQHHRTRQLVTQMFIRYRQLCEKTMWPRYQAVEHWAKVEITGCDRDSIVQLQKRIQHRCDVASFQAARMLLDPKNVLGTSLLDTIFSIKEQ